GVAVAERARPHVRDGAPAAVLRGQALGTRQRRARALTILPELVPLGRDRDQRLDVLGARVRLAEERDGLGRARLQAMPDAGAGDEVGARGRDLLPAGQAAARTFGIAGLERVGGALGPLAGVARVLLHLGEAAAHLGIVGEDAFPRAGAG